MTNGQLPFRQLLRESAIFREWVTRVPTLRVVQGPDAKPWRIYLQKQEGGKWGRADFATYDEVYTAVRLRLRKCYDMTIHSKSQQFAPPRIKLGKNRHWLPMPPGHDWCELCRRPTVFSYFIRHPALRYAGTGEDLRCGICGMRLSQMGQYPTDLVWGE